MARSFHAVAAAFAVTLALAAPSYAAPAKAAKVAHSVVGTLQKVDGQTITVQTPKGAETVMLVSSSRIHRGASTIQAAKLSSFAGERVKVRYLENNGEKQAQTVTLSSAPKTAAPAKSAAQKTTKPTKS